MNEEKFVVHLQSEDRIFQEGECKRVDEDHTTYSRFIDEEVSNIESSEQKEMIVSLQKNLKLIARSCPAKITLHKDIVCRHPDQSPRNEHC